MYIYAKVLLNLVHKIIVDYKQHLNNVCVQVICNFIGSQFTSKLEMIKNKTCVM